MKCEIKKYDSLPARIGWIDIDSLRYKYYNILKQKARIEETFEKAIKKQKAKK